MNKEFYACLGMMLPFLGTSLGAAAVFMFSKRFDGIMKKALVGFAAGIMIAASVWSLLIPSVEMANSWFPGCVGLILGILSLMAFDKLLSKLQNKTLDDIFGDSFMLVFSITLHNIPEGMAVGVVIAGMLKGVEYITPLSALMLSAGIAAQNIPEGAIVSSPMAARGMKKGKSFLCGVMSGVVEPVASIFTVVLTSFVQPILPYILSFAAGAMLYVVVEELIPEIHEDEKHASGIVGFALGFALMFTLDIVLG